MTGRRVGAKHWRGGCGGRVKTIENKIHWPRLSLVTTEPGSNKIILTKGNAHLSLPVTGGVFGVALQAGVNTLRTLAQHI
jgi:hypothetical protein